MAQIDSDVIDRVKEFLRKLTERGIYIESAYLFGSCASNSTSRWSDIDVAVVSPDFSHDRLEERIRLMTLSAEIDSRIEPVPFHTNDFIDEDHLVGEIKRNGISLSSA
jgi:predicted nucleotidyltransferase